HRAVREDDPRPPADDEVFSFHYDLGTGHARIASPAFRHGLKLLQRLQGCRPEKEAADPPASFLKGEAVLCLANPSWIGRFQSQAGWQGLALAGKTEALLQILREQALHPQVKNPVTRLRTPDEQSLRSALLSEIRATLLPGKDPDTALQDALKLWQNIDEKK